NYTNGTDSKVVEVFGWSSIKFNASGSYLKGSNVKVPVRVENAETGNGIGNYNVTVYRKNESASSFKKLDRSSTNINGWANFTWDTSNVALGNHTLKASINDSENLFFNATEFNETSKVFIGGSLQPEVEQAGNKTVYRDQFSTPRATNITVNVSSAGNAVDNSEAVFHTSENRIGSCLTNSSGLCTFTWNPSNTTEIGNLTVNISADHPDYFQSSNISTSIEVRTAAKPSWKKGDQKTTYNFSSKQGINLTAEVLETFTDQKIPGYSFNASYGKRKNDFEAPLNTVNWSNTGTGQLKDTAQGLKINDTEATLSTDLEERELAVVELSNSTGTAKTVIQALNTVEKSFTGNGSYRISFNDSKVSQLKVATNNSVIVEGLKVVDTDLNNSSRLMERKILGHRFYSDMDFEPGRISNSFNACDSTASCLLNGTYVGTEPGYADYVEGIREEAVFGSQGLLMNISSLPVGETVSVKREYDTLSGNDISVSDASRVSFWTNSSLPVSFQAEDASGGCITSKTWNGTENWVMHQFSLESYKSSCGSDVGRFEIEVNNTNSSAYSGKIGIDEVSFMYPVETNGTGSRKLNWLPPSTGNYSFRTEISAQGSYNISQRFAFKQMQLASSSGGTTAGAETGGKTTEENEEPSPPGQTGNITSFLVQPEKIESTVAAETYGTLGTINIENNASMPIDVKISEVENPGLLNVTNNVSLAFSEVKEVDVGFNSSKPGDYNASLALFRAGADSKTYVNVTVHVRNLTMEIEGLTAENGANNLSEGDKITATGNMTFNQSKPAENATWDAEVNGRPCSGVSSGYSNSTGLWTVNCSAPGLEQNPINASFELTGFTDNLAVRDREGVKYRDVTPPFVTSKRGENVEQGDVATVNVSAFDNVGISSVSGKAVLLETGQTVENLSFTEQNGRFTADLTNTSSEGDYDAVVNLTDVNNHTRTVRVPVSVHPFVNFTGSMNDTEAEFKFTRPSSDAVLQQASSDKSYDIQVQNRSYDIGMNVTPDELGTVPVHNVELKNASVNGNMADPVTVGQVDKGSTVSYGHPPGTTNKSFAGLTLETNISFSEAKIGLNYSLNEDFDEEEELNLRIFKCSFSNIEQCGRNDWVQLESNVSAEKNIVEGSTASTSSYIVERLYTPNKSTETDTGEDDQTGQADTGILPNIGAGQRPQLNDSVAEEPFVLSPRIFQPVMFRGERRTFLLEVNNNRETPIQLEMEVEGEISKLLSVEDSELNISSNSTAITELEAFVPEDAEIKTYTGNIIAEYGNTTVNSSQSIIVARQGQEGFALSVEALTRNVEPGANFSFQTRVSDITLDTPLTVNLTHYFRESDTNDIIKQLNDSFTVSSSKSVQREISTKDIPSGSYYVQTVARARNATVVDSATVVVQESFWTPLKTRALILLIAVLLISVVGWKGYQYYWEKKEEESRYVFPVDYDRLPADTEDNYWVGKIAETEKDSFIDPDDLTTHAIVSGSTGSGKSVTANVIAEEALENDVPVIVFDPTAQWTGFVKELKDDDLEEHYSRFDMNPQEDPHPYRGVIKEVNSSDPDINFEELRNEGEITVFTLNQLTTEQFDDAVRNIIDQIFDKDWEESPELEMLIVFDEVHRLLEEYGGQGGYEALERGAREFRKWGIGLMMCSQVTADFKQAISGNIMTEIQMQTKSMEDINRVEKKYGEEFAKRISSEDVGTGMIQNSNYNDGEPWFVDFRPTYHNPHKIPDEEMDKYHKLSEEIDKLKDKLEEMEEQGEDTRDKDLELQLAENKLKEGRFKMANMYIDSLKDELGIE
ncbi:MAG: helicase HerA domain-containing protein, partial [Candidatus Nanohalobium sp.]